MRFTTCALLVLFSAILATQVLVPPPIGMTNNADFSKVAAAFNLVAPPDDEWRFLTRIWRFDASRHWWSGFVSVEHGLTAVAVGVDRIIRRDGRFDIRILGAIH